MVHDVDLGLVHHPVLAEVGKIKARYDQMGAYSAKKHLLEFDDDRHNLLWQCAQEVHH